MTECFRCGSDEHLSRDCPNRTRGHLTPVPPAPQGAAGAPRPPAAPADPAIARDGARRCRKLLGWPQPETTPGDAT